MWTSHTESKVVTRVCSMLIDGHDADGHEAGNTVTLWWTPTACKLYVIMCACISMCCPIFIMWGAHNETKWWDLFVYRFCNVFELYTMCFHFRFGSNQTACTLYTWPHGVRMHLDVLSDIHYVEGTQPNNVVTCLFSDFGMFLFCTLYQILRACISMCCLTFIMWGAHNKTWWDLFFFR